MNDRGGSGGFDRWPAKANSCWGVRLVVDKPFKATDQTNPGLLQQLVELFGSALLLATGRAMGQAKVLESLLIPPCNGGRKPMSVLMAQVTLRNQGISTTDPTVQRSTSDRLALRCCSPALLCLIMGASVLD